MVKRNVFLNAIASEGLRPILYSFFVLYEMFFFAIIHRALFGIQAGVQAIAESPGQADISVEINLNQKVHVLDVLLSSIKDKEKW